MTTSLIKNLCRVSSSTRYNALNRSGVISQSIGSSIYSSSSNKQLSLCKIINNQNEKRYYTAYTKMNIFDTKVKNTQKSNIATTVEDPQDSDYLFNEVADRLTDRILDIKNLKCGKVLDFGCRNGSMIKLIQERGGNIESLTMVDSSKEMLYRDESFDSNYKIKPNRVLVDSLEDTLPLEDGTFDLIMSNLSLHWINDLPGVFTRLNKLLKPNGVFLASLFGEDTLIELKDSLYLSEIERDGGFSPHVSPFTKISDIGNLLSRSKFSLPTIDTEKITINYDNMFILMRDLQNMGENNAILKRRNYTSKDTFLSAAAVYQYLYGNENGSIPATFQVIYLIGWSPHESQQKPKARGSATKHFSELDSTFSMKLNQNSSSFVQQPPPQTIDTSSIDESSNSKKDPSLNEPYPQTDDFVIKRLDIHGNFHPDPTKHDDKKEEKDKDSK
ncbi:hypothetical protein CYY_008710 [Polysphondylium violaceum]|uniref:Methyltransferase type 11 domain-containing protein n=1 Tax=Polysphondylium violaceum TaxID=133409 RepID=A0A8J4PLA0_9MYCE|nr:hypothetical protein CYY_008710 [Polysphondylium violaceum]